MLPTVAVFLIDAMTQEDLLGTYTNGSVANALGAVVTVVTVVVGLDVRTLCDAAGVR